VSAQDVRRLVAYVAEADIFEMVDALGRRDIRRATALLHRMLDEGKAPLYLLAMIVRQFRIMIQVKELASLGANPDETSKRLRLHGYVVKKALAQARNFSFDELTSMYDSLAEYDAAIKTGKIDDDLALDLLIAGVATGGASHG
jgi:DNA polymerase-3 subunit delta